MSPAQVAAEIRADAFREGARNLVPPRSLAAAARVLSAGLAERVERILEGRPWYWRLLFGRGLRFAVEVLESITAQITADHEART